MTPRGKAAVAVALWPVVFTAAAVAFAMMDSLPETVATHLGEWWRRRRLHLA